LWGDTPYRAEEERVVPQLIDQMNVAKLDIAINVGDLFGSRCEDAKYTRAAAWFDQFTAPLVYTPGDNEWTDCHESPSAHTDSLERLAFIRRTMFSTDSSFGQRKIHLEQQRPDYPENSRWHLGKVMFATVDVPGSDNGHVDPAAPAQGETRSTEQLRTAEAEYQARDRADVDWLHQAFDIAKAERAPAVVIAMQADPSFEVPALLRTPGGVDGFDRLLSALVNESKAYGRPVILLHGDTHHFVDDHPLFDQATGARVDNFTRIETFGSPDVGWVEIRLDPANPANPVVTPHRVGP
jgi:hypothetical protein